MTPELEDRILSLFASGLGWEDAAAELLDACGGNPERLGLLNKKQLRTSVQNLWREYVSGKDKA